jgi:ankyrin repeat protein
VGSRDILSLLVVEYKADPDRVVDSGTAMRPIHWAAAQGQLESMEFLLLHRVNINSTDSKGCTPVVIATQHKQLNSVIFLVKHGADMSISDCNGDNALHWSAYGGHLELAGLLVYFMPAHLDAPDRYGQVLCRL